MELKCLVPQLSPMQIALSTDSITENSQQAVLFDAFFLFIFCHDVIICGTAASLVNVSDSQLLISLPVCLASGLPPLLHGLLQYLQYPHTVSVFVLLSSCCEVTSVVKKNTCHQGKNTTVSHPGFQNCTTEILSVKAKCNKSFVVTYML